MTTIIDMLTVRIGDMGSAEQSPLAVNLRRLRRSRGLPAVELARRAGLARATLTQLEAGGGNPTLETLYALANALDAPLAELIAEPKAAALPRVLRRGEGARVAGVAVEAWLLATISDHRGGTEIYDFTLRGSSVQRSAPHAAGTREHLHLYEGGVAVGPAASPVELGPGDFTSFDADCDHLYQRLGAVRAAGVLVITKTA
jgi:transcriptional regulator with XRE-family HTH domain